MNLQYSFYNFIHFFSQLFNSRLIALSFMTQAGDSSIPAIISFVVDCFDSIMGKILTKMQSQQERCSGLPT